jgi:hypothetical protein
VSTLHAELHAVDPLHMKGAHATVVAALHVPAPSHVRALVWVDVPVGQVAATQTVPAA